MPLLKKVFVATLLVLSIRLTSGQQCRHMTVCDNDATPSSSSTVGGFGAFKTEVEQMFQELKLLATPASCLGSSVYGKQHLRSGEEVFCDNGWTVFQRRFDGSVNFDQDWSNYKSGFGNLTGEFWLGLDRIHAMTANKGCKMRVDLWSFNDEHAFAEYSAFHVEDESDMYRLHIGGYSGTAGDSITGPHTLNQMAFTTRDKDNDRRGGENCASTKQHPGGGWWHNDCFEAALNAPWGRSSGNFMNIVWFYWKGQGRALKSTLMKMRCD